jgi:hypothetical protein
VYSLILRHIQTTGVAKAGPADDLPPRADSSAANYMSDGSIGPKGMPLEMRTLDRAMTSTPTAQSFPPPSRGRNGGGGGGQPQSSSTTHFWFNFNFRQHTFLVYPLIYVCCTTPLAASRIAIMAGERVSLPVLCFAGAAISCNGWLDVLLYATTRRSIIFGSDMGASSTGLATFAFMNEPASRRLGNETVIESAPRQPSDADDGPGGSRGRSRWPGWGGGGGSHQRVDSRGNPSKGASGEPKGGVELRGFQGGAGGGGGNGGGGGRGMNIMGIHQTTTTMVVLEDTEEFDAKGGGGSGKGSALPSTGLSRSDSVRSLI